MNFSCQAEVFKLPPPAQSPQRWMEAYYDTLQTDK